MNPLTEITKQRSLANLIPPIPTAKDMSEEESMFYYNIGLLISQLEGVRSHIQTMRKLYKKATRSADDAYCYASDRTKTKEERMADKAIKERTESYLKHTTESIKHVTQNLSECLEEMRPILRIQELF